MESSEETPPRASGWSGSSIPAAPPPPLQGCTSGDAGPLPPLGADCRSRPSLAFCRAQWGTPMGVAHEQVSGRGKLFWCLPGKSLVCNSRKGGRPGVEGKERP